MYDSLHVRMWVSLWCVPEGCCKSHVWYQFYRLNIPIECGHYIVSICNVGWKMVLLIRVFALPLPALIPEQNGKYQIEFTWQNAVRRLFNINSMMLLFVGYDCNSSRVKAMRETSSPHTLLQFVLSKIVLEWIEALKAIHHCRSVHSMSSVIRSLFVETIST